MAKTTTTQKEPVRLREKKLSNGNVSLYLDICRNGRRHKEYLKLYLIDAKTPLEREQNRQTLATAQAVKSKRLIEIQNGEYTFTRQFKENTPFLEYYRKMVEERRKNPESQGNWGNWRSCLRYLEIYCDEKTTFREVTPEFITGFKEFLNNVEKDTHKRVGPRRERDTFQGLSQNSKVSYFNKLRACINQAYDDQIIPVNPLRGIEGFKEEEVKRDYLTLDEVKKLAATPCRYPVLKRAFLFSCLTGLRKSDIQKLTWGEVQKFGKYTRIVFKQRKTKGQEYLDISSQAEKYLGERGNPDDIVFTGFTYGSWTSLELQRWSLAAGVNKNLTFHRSRHSVRSQSIRNRRPRQTGDLSDRRASRTGVRSELRLGKEGIRDHHPMALRQRYAVAVGTVGPGSRERIRALEYQYAGQLLSCGRTGIQNCGRYLYGRQP